MTDRKEEPKKGCGKRMSGEYPDGGYWEMNCGDLNRLCPRCKLNHRKGGKSD